MASNKPKKEINIENRKAKFNYFLSDFMTAGLVLTGSEIKSIRAGHANLIASFVTIDNGEAWVKGMTIVPYKEASAFDKTEEDRPRKLLLTKKEIVKLEREITKTGVTCVPVRLFLQRGYAKLAIAIAKGKQDHDKRDVIKERDTKRRIARSIREGVKASGE